MVDYVNFELNSLAKKSPTAEKVIRKIREDGRIFFVWPNRPHTQVNRNSMRIADWSLTKSVVVDDSINGVCFQQPKSVALVHEFAHMLGDKDLLSVLPGIKDEYYNNKEEKRVMINFEAKIMNELGLPARRHHQQADLLGQNIYLVEYPR